MPNWKCPQAIVIAIMLVPILTGVNARAAPSGSGKIVFVKTAERFAQDQIYVMNEDGSNVTRLWGDEPHVPGTVLHLAASPDGRKIAIQYNRNGTAEHIYVISVDRSDLTKLAPGDEELEEDPAFSPDGRKIAFSCQLGKPQTELVVPNLGRVVARVFQICIMNADGSNVTRLTNPPSENTRPVFSPDGRKIVFNSSYRDGGQQIYMMNVDGSNVTRLTNLRNPPLLGAFSRDGRKIALTSQNVTLPSSPGVLPAFSGEIYVMNADGSNVRRLISRPGSVAGPTFSPDGSKIAFTVISGPGEDDFQIYIMDADGSNVVQLTNPPGTSRDPAFIP